jgi:tetratricopeptide (TPR) repeat protein
MMSEPVPTPGEARAGADRPRARWGRFGLLLLLLLAATVAGGWRYKVTRPDYRLARGHEAVGRGDWDAAGGLADLLDASGHPDHARLLRGEMFLARGNPESALAELNQVQADGPLRARAASLIGRALIPLGRLREAYQTLAFAVEEQPDDVEAQRGLAVIAYDLGQLDAAVAHLERVAELDPQDGRPHRLIGLICKDLSRRDRAVDAYREALKRHLAPAVAEEVRAELADVLVRQGQAAEALAVLDPVPADAGDELGVPAVRAEALNGVGRRQDAIQLIDRAVARWPTPRLYRLRGQYALDAGDTTTALKAAERAVALAPADYEAHYLLAQVYGALGRKGDAARETARVEELRQDFGRLTALSREAMERPWDAGVRLQLADLSDRLGRPKLAEMWRAAAAACSGRPR